MSEVRKPVVNRGDTVVIAGGRTCKVLANSEDGTLVVDDNGVTVSVSVFNVKEVRPKE